MTTNDMMLIAEVANETRTTTATVRWWIRVGKLRATRPGRHLLVRRSDLQAFLVARVVGPALHKAGEPTTAAPEALSNTTEPKRVAPSELDRRRADEALKRHGL